MIQDDERSSWRRTYIGCSKPRARERVKGRDRVGLTQRGGRGMKSLAIAVLVALGSVTAQASEKTLPIKVDDVHKEMNKVSRSIKSDLRATRDKCSAGVQKICVFKVTRYVSIMAAADLNEEMAKEVTVVAMTPPGEPSESMSAILVYSMMMKVLSPGAQQDEYGDTLLSLFEAAKNGEKRNAEIGSVSYSLYKTDGMGLWFIAVPSSSVQ